jgi:glycosyltransferase involved in cell wall biosynthesis
MTDEGVFGPGLRNFGIPLETLGMRRGSPQLEGLARLVRLLRRECPDRVQTWMYHADLLGGLAAQLAGRPPVVWGIRHSDLRAGSERLTTRLTARLNGLLSPWLPARIVCNSEASLRVHKGLGYDAARLMVIPNGFDLEEFRPDPQGRELVRHELGVPTEVPVVGHVGRYHLQKDHRNFVWAAARLRTRIDSVHFLLAGEGVTQDNLELVRWIRESGLGAAAHLVGKQANTPRLFAAMDVFCLSSSHGESFPQVVGEAMACGIPCVVTDVGDAAAIVGSTGLVVPPGDATRLSAALENLLSRPRQARIEMGEAARERIRTNYSLERVVGRYAELYTEVGRVGRRASATG